MSERKLSAKYNDSCLKMFELLQLLSQGETPFADVIKLFADENGEVSPISNVLLNKYLNTLKIFGIKIKKSKNKYYLLRMPYSISLGEKELYTVALMKSAMSFLPNGKNKVSIEQFINGLEMRYDIETKRLSAVVASTRNYDLSFYFMKFEKQIANCEKYCQDGKKIEIYYIDSEGNATNMLCFPQDVNYFEKTVCLNVYNPLTRQMFDIPIDSIKNIKQLESLRPENPDKTCTTVIFKVKGDLAKRYKLRDWERIQGAIESDGSYMVVNTGEDFQSLAVRLFKYDENCVVYSPKYLRTKISRMIDKTLKNYE